jgi:hypothetical protein
VRSRAWLTFLRKIESLPSSSFTSFETIIPLTNTPRLNAWLKRHPRFHLHFIPISSSWLNLVERSFGEITARSAALVFFYENAFASNSVKSRTDGTNL